MDSNWDLTPDSSRRERLGFDETIFCAGKSIDQVRRLIEAAQTAGDPLLLTRLEPAKHAGLPGDVTTLLDYDEVSQTAILGAAEPVREAARVAIVSAGTSDVSVAREAALGTSLVVGSGGSLVLSPRCSSVGRSDLGLSLGQSRGADRGVGLLPRDVLDGAQLARQSLQLSSSCARIRNDLDSEGSVHRRRRGRPRDLGRSFLPSLFSLSRFAFSWRARSAKITSQASSSAGWRPCWPIG